MIKLTLKNKSNDSILNEIEIEPNQLAVEKPLWEMQVHLYSLEGINSSLEILDLDAPPPEID